MPFTTIVAPETLAKGLGDPDWLVLDARFSLDDQAWGRRGHAEAHIPGGFMPILRPTSPARSYQASPAAGRCRSSRSGEKRSHDGA